jgi:hypothetical protein
VLPNLLWPWFFSFFERLESLFKYRFQIEVAQPAVGMFLAFTYGLALGQQVATAVQKLRHLKRQPWFPTVQPCVLQFVIQVFELNLRQLMLACQYTQPGQRQSPMKTGALTACGMQALLDFPYRGLQPVLAQPWHDIL